MSNATGSIRRLKNDEAKEGDDITLRQAKDAAADTAACWDAIRQRARSEDTRNYCARKAAECRNLGEAAVLKKFGAAGCASRLTKLLSKAAAAWCKLIGNTLDEAAMETK